MAHGHRVEADDHSLSLGEHRDALSLAATQGIFQTIHLHGMAFVYRSRGFGVSFRVAGGLA